MNPAEAIYSLLNADSALEAYVGEKIYPIALPDDMTFPALVYSQLSEDEEYTKDGPVNNGFVFTVSVYAGNHNQCQLIALAAKNALKWKSVTITGGTTLRFKFEDQADAEWDDEKDLYHKMLDFRARII